MIELGSRYTTYVVNNLRHKVRRLRFESKAGDSNGEVSLLSNVDASEGGLDGNGEMFSNVGCSSDTEGIELASVEIRAGNVWEMS